MLEEDKTTRLIELKAELNQVNDIISGLTRSQILEQLSFANRRDKLMAEIFKLEAEVE